MGPLLRWFRSALLLALVGCVDGSSYWRADYAKPAELDASGRQAYFDYILEHAHDPLPDPSHPELQPPRARWADGSERPIAAKPEAPAVRESAEAELTRERDRRASLAALPFQPLAVSRMAGLVSVARQVDPVLAARARRWLALQTESLVTAYDYFADVVERSGSDRLWQRGVIDWATWVSSDWQAMNDDAKLTVATGLFGCRHRAFDHASPLDRVVDRFAFGKKVVDEWIQAGRPTDGFVFGERVLEDDEDLEGDATHRRKLALGTSDLRSVLFRKVVLGPSDCHPLRPSRSKPSTIAAYAAPGWMSFALATPEGTSRLAAALVEYREPVLFLALLDALGRPRWEEVLHPFATDPIVARAMNQAIVLGASRPR